MIATTKPFGQTGPEIDQAADSAESALRSTQRVANETLDTLTDKVHDMRDQAAPAINRVAAKAEELARRSADAMRERSEHLKERAHQASDATVHYIKDEPMKAILIAAAAGAALMALISLLGNRRH
jgi:ElaB/YqjD/DUF883 family membrane-anchored ribosome-binding protein